MCCSSLVLYKGAVTSSRWTSDVYPWFPVCSLAPKHRGWECLKGNILWTRAHFLCPAQGEGTSEVHLQICSQRWLPFIIREAFYFFVRKLITYQVCIHISTDDHKKGLEVNICSDNILLSNIMLLRKSPPSMSVCLLIACYTVQQDHVKPKHPGYDCFLSSVHSKPLTFLFGCAELWASLVTAVLLSC